MFYSSKAKAEHHRFENKAYLTYFGIKLGDQDNSWAPYKVCRACLKNLRQSTKGKRKILSFGIPMVWRALTNHVDDCYFCIVNVAGFS